MTMEKENDNTSKIEKEETIKAQQLPIYKLESYLRRGITFDENGKKIKVEGDHKISMESLQAIVPFKDKMGEAYFKELKSLSIA